MSAWGGYSLVCYSVLLLSWVCVAFNGIFVIFTPTSPVLSLAGTNGINCVSVLHFPDQGDLSYVVTG